MLFAANQNGILVSARDAQKKETYTCIECGTSLRVRGGFYKKPHYYHTVQTRKCRASGKSLAHIRVQDHIKHLLPEGECTVESPFETIGRIADVVWHPKKLVFEVQCSPISVEEIQARNRDYLSVGYQVVWILHDKRYNRRRETAVQHYLKKHPHYYTNIGPDGKGMIYDALRICGQDNVRSVLGPYPTNLSQPIPCVDPDKPVPDPIKERIYHWPFCFSGDLISRGCSLEWSERPCSMSKKRSLAGKLLEWFAFPYRMLFQMMLEKSSR